MPFVEHSIYPVLFFMLIKYLLINTAWFIPISPAGL